MRTPTEPMPIKDISIDVEKYDVDDQAKLISTVVDVNVIFEAQLRSTKICNKG